MAENSCGSKVLSGIRQDFVELNSIAKEDLLQKNSYMTTLKDQLSEDLSIDQNVECVVRKTTRNDSYFKGESEVLFNWENFSPMNSFDRNVCSFDPKNDPMILDKSSDENLELSFTDYDIEDHIFELGSHSEYSVSETSTNYSKNSDYYNGSSDLVSDMCNVEFENESETYMGKFMSHDVIYKNLRKPSLKKLLDSGNYISEN